MDCLVALPIKDLKKFLKFPKRNGELTKERQNEKNDKLWKSK